MFASLYNLFGFFAWFVWCCILDYAVYIFVDYVARTRLKHAKNDEERNVIWQYMCFVLVILSLLVYYYHHLPGLLWALIATTLILTFRVYLTDRYYSYKSYTLRLGRSIKDYSLRLDQFLRVTWERLKFIRKKPPSTTAVIGGYSNFHPSPSATIRRGIVESDINHGQSTLMEKPNYSTHNGPTNSAAFAPLSTSADYERVARARNGESESFGNEEMNLDPFMKYASPSQRFLRKPLRTSFESSGYGSPAVASSTPLLIDTPPTFRPTVSPSTARFTTSTPVDPWQLRGGAAFRTSDR